MASNSNVWVLLIILVLVILVLINIYKPFITTHPAEPAHRILTRVQHTNLVNQVKAELADIAEASLIKLQSGNTLTGGFDTNTQTNVGKDVADNTRLVIAEGFDTTVPLLPESYELRLFYRPDCSYSNAFIPVWLEIANSLPSNVAAKEVNCGILDANGISVCANWLEYGGGITSVPALQLVSNINGVKKTTNYTGSRNYKQIQDWLRQQGITLKYNPNAEHFTDNNPMAFSYGAKEGFTNDSISMNLLENPDSPNGDPGTMADNYDKAFLQLAQEDAHGHIRDLDENGFYKASFSTCKDKHDSAEGYQVFTRRGQWGCITPDPKTGIDTPFKAAFAAVDSYLSMLPPLTDPETGKLTGKERTDEERMEMKRGMAAKHAKDIRAFGLCDEDKLRAKYNIYERVKSGKANLPPGVSLKDYLDTQETAAAIYGACSI